MTTQSPPLDTSSLAFQNPIPQGLREGNAADIPAIRHIATIAWHDTYSAFISPDFLSHELERHYSDAALQAQMAAGHRFLIAESAPDMPVGFVSYGWDGAEATLNKIYLLPQAKGHGFGGRLMTAVVDAATRAGCKTLGLYVARENPQAIGFYQRFGFAIVRAEDIPVGGDFVRHDYWMVKPLDTEG